LVRFLLVVVVLLDVGHSEVRIRFRVGGRVGPFGGGFVVVFLVDVVRQVGLVWPRNVPPSRDVSVSLSPKLVFLQHTQWNRIRRKELVLVR
jgi:hypothetical protein